MITQSNLFFINYFTSLLLLYLSTCSSTKIYHFVRAVLIAKIVESFRVRRVS